MDTKTITPPISVTSRFRGEVLNKIYRVWLFRTFLPVLIGEIVVFSFVLYELGKVIFFQRILENAMNVFFQNPTHLVSFFVFAFADARLATKALIVVVAIILALLIRQITQGLLRYILVRQNYFGKVEHK